MSVYTKVIISENSCLTLFDVKSFESKVKSALEECANGLSTSDCFCRISVDGVIDDSVKTQFSKVGNNVFVGFANDFVDAKARRLFIFKCMAINDDKLQDAKNVVILVSSKPINTIGSGNQNKEEDDEKKESFIAVTPKYSLSKVILNDLTKNQIQRAIALVRNQKLIFDDWGFREVDPNTKTILCFFGAPGTGKTMCAHAVARELGKKIMIASYASIESKWVGEGPKNMRRIFEDATEQDAVLFFDEADSFLSKRVNNAETGSDKHYNRMSNEMFQLLEDFNGIVIFATNLVTDFDKAFKSRILSFVEFTLPDESTRARLISSMLPSKLPLAAPLSDAYVNILSKASDGFSGRDIRKALLTSLAEGATRRISSFSVDDLLVGFNSVQQEREAVEETACRERNVISDYLQTTQLNGAILNICHWAFDQSEKIPDASKEAMYKVSKLLNLEMPDLSISYKNKDIDLDCDKIKEGNKAVETLCYVIFIVGNSLLDKTTENVILSTLCEKLGYDNASKASLLLESFKAIYK